MPRPARDALKKGKTLEKRSNNGAVFLVSQGYLSSVQPLCARRKWGLLWCDVPLNGVPLVFVPSLRWQNDRFYYQLAPAMDLFQAALAPRMDLILTANDTGAAAKVAASWAAEAGGSLP